MRDSQVASMAGDCSWTKEMEWWMRVTKPPPPPDGRSRLRTVYPGKLGSLERGPNLVSWRQATRTLFFKRKLFNSIAEPAMPLQFQETICLNWRGGPGFGCTPPTRRRIRMMLREAKEAATEKRRRGCRQGPIGDVMPAWRRLAEKETCWVWWRHFCMPVGAIILSTS